MAVDVVLWFILAAVIGLICCGCVFTGDRKKPLDQKDGDFERALDRAA